MGVNIAEKGFLIHPDSFGEIGLTGQDIKLVARQQFLSRLTALNRLEQFPEEVNLGDFLAYFKQSGILDDLIIEGFLHVKKEQLNDGATNPVNYVADIVQAAINLDEDNQITGGNLDFKSERFHRGLTEVMSNLLAMVAEHPLAKVTKREPPKNYFWVNDQGNWRLRGEYGFFDEILQEAQLSSQKKPFETARYKVNEQNYNSLRDHRVAMFEGEINPVDEEVFVEFSPSPELTTAAKDRGYLGNDCIFFFKLDPVTGNEVQEQRWLKVTHEEFAKFLTRLTGNPLPEVSDVTIMKTSNFFSASE
ncbi:MAG: hypothetical protein AAB874_00815, partial [Patescibacteria group bacterium]